MAHVSGSDPNKFPRRVRHSRRVVIGVALLVLLIVGTLVFSSRGGLSLLFGRDLVWNDIQRTHTWRVGMDPSFPPFEMEDPSNHQIIGYDADLARAIAARWGVQVELKPIGFDSLMDAIWARQIDAAISALPLNPRFTEDLVFSSPYFEAGLMLIVPAGSSIRTSDDLAQRKVAVEWGSNGDGLARSLRNQVQGLVIQPYADPTTTLDAVSQAKADAAIVDAVSARTYIAAHPQASLRLLEPPLQSEGYVVMSPIRAPTLQKQIGDAIAALRADGTLSQLEAKWFAPATP